MITTLTARLRPAGKRLSPRAAIALAVAGVLLLALVAYMLVISPRNAKASELARQADAAEAAVERSRKAKLASTASVRIRSADLFRLTKAMPRRANMADVVLELSALASDTGISFESIAPQPAAVVGAYQVVPITLVFNGSFYDLSDFVYRLRHLVSVRGGALRARGRLYSIDSLTFDATAVKWPRIQATLTLAAYVYGVPGGAAPGGGTTPAPPATPSGTTAAGGGNG